MLLCCSIVPGACPGTQTGTTSPADVVTVPLSRLFSWNCAAGSQGWLHRVPESEQTFPALSQQHTRSWQKSGTEECAVVSQHPPGGLSSSCPLASGLLVTHPVLAALPLLSDFSPRGVLNACTRILVLGSAFGWELGGNETVSG